MSLNDYHIFHQVGKGQYGQVFKATRKKDNLPVAIKIISKKLNERQQKMANLQISIMKTIDSPQILKLIDNFKREQTFYMVLEYCSRGDLEKVCKKGKSLSQDLVKLIAIELVKALAYLEQMKIAHRDIKLANIYINQNYEVKLADLGFAKMIEEDLLTSYAGTPLNMAPQIFNDGRYTNKCDIWSFGVTIYEMLYGTPPFLPKNKTIEDLIKLVNDKSLEFPPDICVSEQAEDFISRCLQKNPNKRISASELLKHPWILSLNHKKGDLQSLLSRIMFQSGIIFIQEQDQKQNQVEQSYKEYKNMIDKAIVKFSKQFQVKVKKIASNFSQCFKIFSKHPEANHILHSFVQDRIKQIQNLQIIFNMPNNQIIITSEQYYRCKSAVAYLRKLLIHKYQYTDNNQMKLFGLVRQQFDVFYQLVQPIRQLIQNHFGSVRIELQYYQDLDKQLISQLEIKVKNSLNKTKIIEILTKPPEKTDLMMKDIIKTQILFPSSQHQSLAFYLKSLEPMAELKHITFGRK